MVDHQERKKIPPGEFLRKRKTIQMWRGYKIEQDMIEPVEEPETCIKLNGEHGTSLGINIDDGMDCTHQ